MQSSNYPAPEAGMQRMPGTENWQLQQLQMQYLHALYWYQAMMQSQAYWAWQNSMWGPQTVSEQQAAPPSLDRTGSSENAATLPKPSPDYSRSVTPQTAGPAVAMTQNPATRAQSPAHKQQAAHEGHKQEIKEDGPNQKPVSEKSESEVKILPMPQNRPSFQPPRDEIEEQLALFAKLLLKRPNISVHDNFFDLGGNYEMAQRLQNHISLVFNLKLHLDQIYKNGTLESIADEIRSGLATRSEAEDQIGPEPTPSVSGTQNGGMASAITLREATAFKSIVSIRKGKAGSPNLYCVHGAGGNVLFMQRWIKYLSDQSLYGIQARGVDGDVTQLPQSVQEMAQNYVAELRQNQPDGPYWISGYSVGGVIALEMAYQLRESGAEVPLLILFDTYHPAIGARKRTMQEILTDVAHQPRQFLGKVVENRIRSRITPQMSYAERLSQYQSEPKHIPITERAEFVEQHIDHLIEQYKPQQYDGEALLITAEELWQIYDHVDEARGWSSSIPHLERFGVPGDHFSLIEEPNIRYVVKAVNDAIWLRKRE